MRNRFKKNDSRIQRTGVEEAIWQDSYHRLMRTTWVRFFGLLLLLFFFINFIFSMFYMALPGGIAHIEQFDFLEAYYFSVQTLSTIGYGYYYPISHAANLVVAIEAASGLFFTAAVTGLVFAKFSRPSARIIFSENILQTKQNNKPYLMLRMGNIRTNEVDAGTATLTLLRDEITAEGFHIRRLTDLKLNRHETPVFTLSWTLLHPLDPDSPFCNVSEDVKVKENWEVVATFKGSDRDTGHSIAARHTYRLKQIIIAKQFADIISLKPNGIRVVDFSKIHDVIFEPGTV